MGNCTVTDDAEHQRQERLETSVQLKTIRHDNLDRYILNMHSDHNPHLIREALPRHLTAPIHLFPDRIGYHRELAAKLRVTGPAKRAESLAKAQETRKRNKAAKAKQALGGRLTVLPEEPEEM